MVVLTVFWIPWNKTINYTKTEAHTTIQAETKCGTCLLLIAGSLCSTCRYAGQLKVLTVILRGVAFSTFGSLSFRTPSFNTASILDWSMTSERVNCL